LQVTRQLGPRCPGTAKTAQFIFQSVSPPRALALPLKMGTSASPAGQLYGQAIPIRWSLVEGECRLLALSGRLRTSVRCLLSTATRTFSGHCRKPRLTETDIARSLSARRAFFETT